MSTRPFYICGPTASGKSGQALALAHAWDAEIVNADAFQLYRGLETITAAPTAAQQALLPHHLYGVLEPHETCDAGRYLEMAQPVIDAIIARGKIPIVTGGSGLYLKFLTHGPSPLPRADATLRAELDATPLEALVAELQKVDPAEAAQITPQNRRYVSRAIEIFRLTGIPASAQRRNWEHVTAAREKHLRGILLQIPRPLLHQRIATRCIDMLENGAIEEITTHRHHLSETCRKAIGVPQIIDLLDKKIDRDTCLQLITQATRQYAKRQETWFRREEWLTPCNWNTQASQLFP
jgi:tRNA dimethylallyltransferase